MKQLQITATDPEYAFEFADVPRPEPGDREVLAKVVATSINPTDWKFAGSDMAPLPHPVGLDVAGTVVETGASVDDFTIGDRIVGQASMKTGTFAPLTVTRARTTAKLPDAVSFTDAAPLGTAGQAAYAAVVEEGQASNGQTILIHGAAGGVGTFAVQLAKHRGARVIATASVRDHDLLRELGVDEAIDYTTTRFEDVARNVDAVIDTVGGDTFLRSIDVLRNGGTMVTLAYFEDPPRDTVERKHLDVRQLSVRSNRNRLAELAQLVSKGDIRPVLGRQIPLTASIDAFHQSMDRHNQGNVVVTLA